MAVHEENNVRLQARKFFFEKVGRALVQKLAIAEREVVEITPALDEIPSQDGSRPWRGDFFELCGLFSAASLQNCVSAFDHFDREVFKV